MDSIFFFNFVFLTILILLFSSPLLNSSSRHFLATDARDHGENHLEEKKIKKGLILFHHHGFK